MDPRTGPPPKKPSKRIRELAPECRKLVVEVVRQSLDPSPSAEKFEEWLTAPEQMPLRVHVDIQAHIMALEQYLDEQHERLLATGIRLPEQWPVREGP